MPYKSRTDLPKPIQTSLPEHAQDIYKEAHNSAMKTYKDDEARSARVAWAAVEKQYKKVGGRWMAKKATTKASAKAKVKAKPKAKAKVKKVITTKKKTTPKKMVRKKTASIKKTTPKKKVGAVKKGA